MGLLSIAGALFLFFFGQAKKNKADRRSPENSCNYKLIFNCKKIKRRIIYFHHNIFKKARPQFAPRPRGLVFAPSLLSLFVSRLRLMSHSPAANQTERGSSSNTGRFEKWRFNL
jgi:hypothetical protein